MIKHFIHDIMAELIPYTKPLYTKPAAYFTTVDFISLLLLLTEKFKDIDNSRHLSIKSIMINDIEKTLYFMILLSMLLLSSSNSIMRYSCYSQIKNPKSREISNFPQGTQQ